MPEVRKRVVYCSYLLALVGATSCLFGVVYISSSEPMPYHLAFVGMRFEEIRDVNPNLAAFFASLIRSLGACFLGIGILGIGIAFRYFQRAERWAWLVVFPAVSIVLADMLRASFLVGADVRWLIVGLTVLFLTAMLLPVKDFFGSRVEGR